MAKEYPAIAAFKKVYKQKSFLRMIMPDFEDL